MTGLKVQFTDSGLNLVPDQAVDGSMTTAQNALVNIGTSKNSDWAYPERGTDLLQSAVRDGIPTQTTARHYANFAAVDTLFFLRDTEAKTTDESLDLVELTPDRVDQNLAVFDVYLQFLNGQKLGRINTPYGVLNV